MEADAGRFGFHAVVTFLPDMPAAQVMETCHGHDTVEKLWRTMKSGLDARSQKTKMDPATQGQIFIVWGAALFHRMLSSAIGAARLDMTVDEALATMRKLRMICTKGGTVAMTPTRKSRDLVVALELERFFPEFVEYFATAVEERERAKKSPSGQKRRGRPPKFRFKATQPMSPREEKVEKKEEMLRQTAVFPRRRGRPPKNDRQMS